MYSGGTCPTHDGHDAGPNREQSSRKNLQTPHVGHLPFQALPGGPASCGSWGSSVSSTWH